MATDEYSPEQHAMIEVWERHTAAEFEQGGRVVDRSAPANRLIDRLENAGS
jgi:hypothetical protein